jgi:hypothetical protein
MPRSLKFKFGDSEFDCELNKVDRSKLYGSVDLETRDHEGNRCGLATLANDGKTLIPYGGTAFGYVNDEGEWVERSELSPVDLSGDALDVLPSSFDLTIELDQKVTVDEFLNHSMRLCYALGNDGNFADELLDSLQAGEIYRFDFLYREGVSADPAFLIATDDSQVWMLVGRPSSIDFVGLDQAAVSFGSSDTEDEESDEFDFEML